MKQFGESLKQGAKLIQQVEQTHRLAKKVEKGVKQGTRAVKKFIRSQSKTKESANSETCEAYVPVASTVATEVNDSNVSESEKEIAVCAVQDDNLSNSIGNATPLIIVEPDTKPTAVLDDSQCSASEAFEKITESASPTTSKKLETPSTASAVPIQSTIISDSTNALELEKQYAQQLEDWRHQLRAYIQEHAPSSLPVDSVELNAFLQKAEMDHILFSFVILQEATPKGLATFAAQGSQKATWVRELLFETHSLRQDMLLSDGAASLPKGGPAQYGPALAIYHSILDRSKYVQQSKKGIFYRLAVAVALEHAVPIKQNNPSQPDKPMNEYVDPLERYLHYESAYLQGELDPLFDTLTIWELRFVVNGEEPDEILSWGRSMLLNYRPDHLREQNYEWKYVQMVRSSIRYGSQDVQHDRPNLQQYQNILMNGGVCGRRAFFGRFILRAFGIPTTARPSPGHGALIHWTPGEKYWVPNLGGPIGGGSTKTVYRKDTDFLATAKARSNIQEFLLVKRAMFYGDVLGEQRVYGEEDLKANSGHWNRVSLATQKSIIQHLPSHPPDRRKIVERKEPTMVQTKLAIPTSPDANKIQYESNGTIVVPGSALENPKRTKDVQVMNSFAGGHQIYLPPFQSQGLTIMRGGTFKSTAEACSSGSRLKSGGYGKYHDWSFRMALSGGDGGGSELSIDLGNNIAMEFVHIPPGKFIMGGKNEKDGRFECVEVPKHEVEISRGFYLGKYPVTQAQWQQMMGNNPSKSTKAPNCPVDNIGESDAIHFCGKMVDTIGKDFRLPTEAEWEYASRGGRADNTTWFFGNDASLLGQYAWYKENSGEKSHPVGQKKPNPFGIYDIYGNVFERVSDKYDKDYYKKSPRLDPTGPSQGIKSTMEYKIPKVPRAGTYALTARVVTANANQRINVAVNGGNEELVLSLPFTNGMWQESDPLVLQLKEGENVLRFWRDKPPQYGVAIKEWILTPSTTAS